MYEYNIFTGDLERNSIAKLNISNTFTHIILPHYFTQYVAHTCIFDIIQSRHIHIFINNNFVTYHHHWTYFRNEHIFITHTQFITYGDNFSHPKTHIFLYVIIRYDVAKVFLHKFQLIVNEILDDKYMSMSNLWHPICCTQRYNNSRSCSCTIPCSTTEKYLTRMVSLLDCNTITLTAGWTPTNT